MSQNSPDGPQPRGPLSHVASPPPASAAPDRSLSRPVEPNSPPPGSSNAASTPAGARTPLRRAGFVVLAAVGIAAGSVWYGMSGIGTPAPAPAPVVESRAKEIRVAAIDADVKATEKLKAILAGGASGAEGAAKDLDAVNAAGLGLLAKTSPKMAADIQSGRRVLYRIYLLDFLVEDGDHVELSVDGVSFGDTTLKGAGTSFLIPLAPGTPARLKLLATADGGGGVTVGFVSSLGEARTQIMQVGDFDQWQAVVQ